MTEPAINARSRSIERTSAREHSFAEARNDETAEPAQAQAAVRIRSATPHRALGPPFQVGEVYRGIGAPHRRHDIIVLRVQPVGREHHRVRVLCRCGATWTFVHWNRQFRR